VLRVIVHFSGGVSNVDKPTVSLGVISLVASSCGYYRGHIEPRAAHEFAVPLATQRGLAKRLQHRHPPRAQPVAPLRERHCRRPRLPPRRCTAQAPYRAQGHPGGTHGRVGEEQGALPCGYVSSFPPLRTGRATFIASGSALSDQSSSSLCGMMYILVGGASCDQPPLSL
jgi:hypothetical protein